jgi:hypothetical protein
MITNITPTLILMPTTNYLNVIMAWNIGGRTMEKYTINFSLGSFEFIRWHYLAPDIKKGSRSSPSGF